MDAEFVGQCAKKNNLQFYTEKADTPGYAKQTHISLETAARDLRYGFLNRIAQETDARYVALGHNANDQAETLLDHLLRGAGLAGLGAMPFQRDIFIRPLLCFKRAEIEEYAQQHKLPFREDSSNQDMQYRRNKLRHGLIPVLQKEYNPQVVDALVRAGNSLRECDVYIKEVASAALEEIGRIENNKILLDISLFLNYLNIIKKYILFAAVEKAGISRYSLNYEKLNRILQLAHNNRSSSSISLSRSWQILVSNDCLVICPKQIKKFDVQLKSGDLYRHGELNWVFQSTIVDKVEMEENRGKSRYVEFIDADLITGALRLRSWRSGDRFKPLGFKGTKKVSDFFVDEKVPLFRRQEIPILECDTGIIWVCGCRLSEDFKISNKTQHILKLEFCEEDVEM
jgi:tRNA(Ile)-lysidine synthase